MVKDSSLGLILLAMVSFFMLFPIAAAIQAGIKGVDAGDYASDAQITFIGTVLRVIWMLFLVVFLAYQFRKIHDG